MTSDVEQDLARLRWTDLDPERGHDPVLVLVPVGSLEQHGPALGLATDAVVAGEVARRAARVLDGRVGPAARVVVAPVQSYGASGEHEGFAGTISIGRQALEAVLVEIGRSACRWARGIVFVNGHGGNVETVVSAVRLLREEGRDAAWTSCGSDGADAHAGRTETSLLLHLAPEMVHPADLEVGATEPLADLMPALRSGGVRAVSANGVLGDPTGADAEQGAAILEEMVARVVTGLVSGAVDDRGRLRG